MLVTSSFRSMTAWWCSRDFLCFNGESSDELNRRSDSLHLASFILFFCCGRLHFFTASTMLLWISSLIRSELHWAYLLSLSCCCSQRCWAAVQLQALLQPPTFFVVVSNGVECFSSTQSGCFSFDCCRCCFHKLFILSWQWNKREQRAQKKSIHRHIRSKEGMEREEDNLE